MEKLQSKEQIQQRLSAIQESIDAHPHNKIQVLQQKRINYERCAFQCIECGADVGDLHIEPYSTSLFKEAVKDFSEGTLGGYATNENI